MIIWRLCRQIHSADAFSGEGARRYGGRWNSRGVPMVYCSTSLALAAIELFVHLDPTQAPDDLVSIAVTLPQGEPGRTIAPAELPARWWTGTLATRELGDGWVHSKSSLAMKVPSVPIRSEWNIVLNPLHPRMAEVRIDPPQAFVFDGRMFRG